MQKRFDPVEQIKSTISRSRSEDTKKKNKDKDNKHDMTRGDPSINGVEKEIRGDGNKRARVYSLRGKRGKNEKK